MRKINFMLQKFFLLIIFFIVIDISAQVPPDIQRYRDDQLGDISAWGFDTLNLNNINTIFFNNGLFGNHSSIPSLEWPIGTNHNYSKGIAMVVSAKVLAPGNNQIIHPLQTYFHTMMDKDPVTDKNWGFEAVPGYKNMNLLSPATSNNPSTWPSTWPAALNLNEDWNGHWYGYWGRDVFTPKLETFFVMDDSQDKEWTQPPYLFQPILNNPDRGGLGLRIEVRQFQWNHYGLKDIIFIQYDIINISDYDYDSVYVGFYNDLTIGGINDEMDDRSSYDTREDIIYGYDGDGIGEPPLNWNTGYMGIAYLETPGNPYNGIDDDEDGMVDERMDDGIDNDGDWVPYTDLNQNGLWDPTEPLNDDVGMDGLSGTGDTGEGDGLPTHGEPNFDMFDKDESDQIGLTSLKTIKHLSGDDYGYPKNDDSYWEIFKYGYDTQMQNDNISIIAGSGPYYLEKWKRIRISAAIIYGEDFEELFNNKFIAQTFYNKSYRYSAIYNASTTILSDVFVGSQILAVENNQEFAIGDRIIINPGGETEETNIVIGFGSILLQDPLQYNHAAGEIVAKLITTGLTETDNKVVTDFKLSQNYPNPFNPETSIKFKIPQTSHIKLTVYDVLGKEVETLMDETLEPGTYNETFNGKNLSSGMYIYRLQTENSNVSGKMLLMK
jgi:hypothetical protein